LDAGWFGHRKKSAYWYETRGDWDTTNRDRFPHGVRTLADYTHANQMKFGLWCEIEALGAKATLNDTRPEFAAMRDGVPLGYICLGNRAARGWTYQTLRRLLRDFDCDWVKLDFNLDPGAGCNRTDHGHDADDGLYEHYVGYYSVLDRLRAEIPEIILENCASGGLRIDLGILQHTEVTFLSDPDYPVHSLQVFWGATTMLAPDACLHWCFSEWLPGDFSEKLGQTFNPRDPNLQPHQFDYYTRIAMLGALGFSQKLPELPEWVKERLAYHIRVYKEQVRRFVMGADLYHLTDQPRRDGTGERWCAFQYSLPEEHLLFVFRLPGAEAERAIRMANLQPERTYRVEDMDGVLIVSMSGRDLMERGIAFGGLQEEESRLLRLV
jgi:alpha-galactosidase